MKSPGYHWHDINCCHALANSLHSPRLGFGSSRPVEYGLELSGEVKTEIHNENRQRDHNLETVSCTKVRASR